jgi:hypothetical protein
VIDDPSASTEPGAGAQVAPPPAAVPVQGLERNATPVSAPAGRGRRWLTAFLALAVLVTGGALALLYNDDLSLQGRVRDLTSANESLQGGNMILQGQLTATQGTLTTAQSEVTRLRSEAQHPLLGIWNVSQSLQGPSYYLAAGIPDTFTYHLNLRSTRPMNVSIISFDQFSIAIKCVENGNGDTNQCMHSSGGANHWLGVTSVNTDFHLAEGCAAYMVVITAPSKVTITPKVSVTYNPASHATGTCS